MLEVLTNEVLPGKLDNGDTLLFGLNINLFKNGTLIDELPADASIVISLSINWLCHEIKFKCQCLEGN